MKTLREVCEEVGVTRRTIQGYEKHCLVEASDRNKMGYLLYDYQAQETIKKIKLFQDMGFHLNEIKIIMNSSNEVRKELLEMKVEEMKIKKKELDELIIIATQMIEKL